MLKVEVNGDVQSGIGTGASHMHHRHDSGGCERGNTAWLIREAKKRNPKVRTYVLSWGEPGWAGPDCTTRLCPHSLPGGHNCSGRGECGAPNASSAVATSAWPYRAARCSAVSPTRFAVLSSGHV